MEAQEIINRVYTRLNDGTGRAYDPRTGSCCYRTPGTGIPCAVGCLITDGEYNPEMDEGDSTGVWYKIHLFPERLHPHLDLLADLQHVHDCNSSWDDKEFIGHSGMLYVAERHGLTFNRKKQVK